MPATRKKIIRIAFWAFVVVTTIPLILIFFKPALPDVPSTPEAARSYDQKMLELNGARSGAGEIRFSEAELNSKVQQSLGDSAASGGAVALKSLTVHLEGNELLGVFRVDAAGVSLYLTIGGIVSESNHRLAFNPTQTALGRLHVPTWLIGPSIRDRLNSADVQSVFTLPEGVRSVRVENGELIFEVE